MTKPFSIPYKQKIIERMSGTDAISAHSLSQEIGIPQQTLSRWLQETHSVPLMSKKKAKDRTHSLEKKIKILSESSQMNGSELTGFLEREGVLRGEFEQWRLALADEEGASRSAIKQIRKLERELARKEKALAETATLLVLKKKVNHLWEEEDDDSDEEKGK